MIRCLDVYVNICVVVVLFFGWTYWCAGCQPNIGLGCSCDQMCAKLYVLITELYGIAGVVNILLDVTFSCVIMWIYVCTRMC